MTNYRLTAEAKEDLRRIYVYGFKEFGERFADEYFNSFFEAFEKIAASPLSYQSVDHFRQGYRRFPHRADVIYYRINQNWIDIMAILGGQDVDIWL
ncbi:type II toxin-antitoxin system RelE/ParE family toxin [Glaciecola sp. MF2-115]|uniref:type II toxin-antitoxin system RelE/ParE family toxin n=1 Tax=Glaciecola sp. MF2-115 TaxID=3384827 RepID=UPI0039A39F69